jgi:hypothetical protein
MRAKYSLEPGGIHDAMVIVPLFLASDKRFHQRAEWSELEPTEFSTVIKVIASVCETAAVIK